MAERVWNSILPLSPRKKAQVSIMFRFKDDMGTNPIDMLPMHLE